MLNKGRGKIICAFPVFFITRACELLSPNNAAGAGVQKKYKAFLFC